ncbi:P-loop ATPase, Sll1717 family [Ruegeria arenilitoris]|uniref:P-loop ATPase, Sll1717 family n=1 Tax=Ruegeria arenilitoris TaxID=1173585 RepID=UPI0014802926|nr:hypothetical protein [Ruegeria arenilitoris]
MRLRDINFGDVDAKNEILKQRRIGERDFFESYSIPQGLDLQEYYAGQKYFVLGLKGTGKTALLRYLHDTVTARGDLSEFILFKSHVSEEDRQKLSEGAGFQIVDTENVPTFIQDFKESWKWLIYQKIAAKLHQANIEDADCQRLYKLTGLSENRLTSTLGELFSKISSGNLKFSGEALGVALELGIETKASNGVSSVSLSSVNRSCALLLNSIQLDKPLYLFFDELELFHQTSDQFDRDRRIIRDLVYSISQINSESAEYGRRVFIISSLRTEVLHSILELGHEIGRDVDDYGDKLDWSAEKATKDHPLLKLIAKKIAVSVNISADHVWTRFFPIKINNQDYYKFLLNSSYYRPRDIVRLLRVARQHNKEAEAFTTAHFDESSTEYSKQTWLEITEELLASYSPGEIAALQRTLLGFKTHFFKDELEDRINVRYKADRPVQELFSSKGVTTVLEDLYRIGVLGNDFIVRDTFGNTKRRHRWIFRGNSSINASERMAIHKSLWKHLTIIPM